jgi:aspartate aminotransferase-like enzyme
MPFQEAHPALLIPGPIELEDDVLRAMGHFRWA